MGKTGIPKEKLVKSNTSQRKWIPTGIFCRIMDPLTRSRGWLPAGEGESDWLLHLDGDRFLFLVDVGGLGKLDVAGSDVAGGRKFDSLLGARNHH